MRSVLSLPPNPGGRASSFNRNSRQVEALCGSAFALLSHFVHRGNGGPFKSPAGRLLVDQTERTRVVRTEKEMQVGILAGIPFRPTMLPIRPSVIAGILAKDGHGRRHARRDSRIENELCAALRASGSILDGDFLLLFRGAHLTTGLETKKSIAIAKEQSTAPAMVLSAEAALRCAMES